MQQAAVVFWPALTAQRVARARDARQDRDAAPSSDAHRNSAASQHGAAIKGLDVPRDSIT